MAAGDDVTSEEERYQALMEDLADALEDFADLELRHAALQARCDQLEAERRIPAQHFVAALTEATAPDPDLAKRYDVLLSAYLRCYRARLERDGLPYSAVAPKVLQQRERWAR